MIMSTTLLRWLIVSVALGFSSPSFAQETAKQEPAARLRQAKPAPKPTTKSAPQPVPETGEKTEAVPQIAEPDDIMRRAITSLSTQIGLLSAEVRGLKSE